MKASLEQALMEAVVLLVGTGIVIGMALAGIAWAVWG